MRRPFYTRVAAASGIDFAAAVAAIAIIERWKDLNNPGEIAVNASANVFATVALLYGVAGVFLFWFVATLAARIRVLEGGSGRLAAAVNTSGAIIAGVLAIGVGAMWAAHQTTSTDSAALATSIVFGPTLFFPAAVLVTAAGLVGLRTPDLPFYSRSLAVLSVPLGIAFVGAAGLMLFKNYAWINETGYIAFTAWILWMSFIGLARWGDMDEAAPTVESRPARRRASPPPETVEFTPVAEEAPQRPRRPRPRKPRTEAPKAAARPSARKTSTRRRPARQESRPEARPEPTSTPEETEPEEFTITE